MEDSFLTMGAISATFSSMDYAWTEGEKWNHLFSACKLNQVLLSMPAIVESLFNLSLHRDCSAGYSTEDKLNDIRSTKVRPISV